MKDQITKVQITNNPSYEKSFYYGKVGEIYETKKFYNELTKQTLYILTDKEDKRIFGRLPKFQYNFILDECCKEI